MGQGYNENRRDPGSNSSRCLTGLWDPTSLLGSPWPLGRTRMKTTQWLTSVYWGCSLDSVPKLSMEHPNSSLKKPKKNGYLKLTLNCRIVWSFNKIVSVLTLRRAVLILRFVFMGKGLLDCIKWGGKIWERYFTHKNNYQKVA